MICRDTPTHGWVWVGGWMGGSMGGSGQMTKNLINLDLIEVIQFCLKIYDCRDTPTNPPTHGWMCGWLEGSVGQLMGSGQMTNN